MLTNGTDHPLFVRTVAPETSKGPVVIALMRNYDWNNIVILTDQADVYYKSGIALAAQFRQQGINAQLTGSVALDNTKILDESLVSIQRSGFRFIFLLAYMAGTRAVLESAGTR